MSSNKSIWVVVAAASVVGLVAAVYVVKLIGERNERRIIASQVNEWSQAWDRSRACLVGEEPALARGSHAYLVREATRGPGMDRLKGCDRYIRRLRRPGEVSTGDVEFEAAWRPVREASKELATAYALTLDTGTRRYDRRRARLAAAIDALDEAYAKLREAAGLDAAPPPGSGEAAELGAGTPITVNGASVRPGYMDRVGNALIMDSSAGEQRHLVAVRGPGSVDSYATSAGVTRAADQAAWGVWVVSAGRGKREMRAGPVTPAGTADGDGVAVVTVADPRQELVLRSVLGHGQARAVIYQLDGDPRSTLGNRKPMAPSDLGVFLVRSLDGGATWSRPVRLADRLVYASSDLGRRRFDMAWRDEAGALRWLGLRADRLDPLPQPKRLFDVGETTPRLEHCVGDSGSWWLQDQRLLFHTAGHSAAARVVERSKTPRPARLVGCLDDRALLGSGSDRGEALQACTARGCEEVMEVGIGMHVAYAATLGEARGPVALSQAGRVLALWRPGMDVAAFWVEDGYELRMAFEWDGEVHAVMAVGDGLRIVPVPWG